MNKMNFSMEELIMLYASVGCFHERAARQFADSLADKTEKYKTITPQEFTETNETIMKLYDKLEKEIKRLAETKQEDSIKLL
jgi:hypothetical protein